MRTRILIISICLILLFSIPWGIVHSDDSVEYRIQIENGGSALWIITLTVTNGSSLDTWGEFRSRVISLVEAAGSRTQRAMDVDEDSFSLSSNSSGSYIIVQYMFRWQNFSIVENSSLTIGDVFQVENLFSQLYGDGEVYLTYPSGYTVKTVTPSPSKLDNSAQTLEWPGTADFNSGNVLIVLTEKASSSGSIVILLGGLIMVVAAASSASVYTVRRRKKKEEKKAEAPAASSLFEVESDEEKIVKLLKSSGGSSYQSAITDHFRFSRAKTSQLLSALEQKGIIKRYTRGRGKIVVLAEKDKKDVE